jgi:hypothetical protein
MARRGEARLGLAGRGSAWNMVRRGQVGQAGRGRGARRGGARKIVRGLTSPPIIKKEGKHWT